MSLRNVTRNLAVGIAAGAALVAVQSAQAADERGSVQGVVTNASGQPVTGAFVKLKNAERRLTFMVPSQDQGRFEAKDLPVGQYTIQGVGGGFQSNVSAPVSVTANAKAMGEYLAANFKALQPYDPNSRLPTAMQQGKGLKYRAVTYDLADHYAEPHDVAADPQGNAWVGERAGRVGRFDPRTLEFAEFKTPPGPAAPDRQSLGNPQIDARGIMWVPDGPNNRWLSFDTKTEKFVAYAWPRNMPGGAGGNSMTLHPDGTIWATGANKEVRKLDPDKVEFKAYQSPSAKPGSPLPGAYGLAVAGDGSVWWAEDEADKMARVDPATGQVEEFNIPDVGGHALPRRMNSDWDGNLWVGIWEAGKLMKIDYKTKQMTMYTPKTNGLGMYSVVADKKNHLIWVSAQQVDKIFRFDPATGEFTEFPLSFSQQDPRRIDLDPTNPNRIFFSGNTADRIGFLELL